MLLVCSINFFSAQSFSLKSFSKICNLVSSFSTSWNNFLIFCSIWIITHFNPFSCANIEGWLLILSSKFVLHFLPICNYNLRLSITCRRFSIGMYISLRLFYWLSYLCGLFWTSQVLFEAAFLIFLCNFILNQITCCFWHFWDGPLWGSLKGIVCLHFCGASTQIFVDTYYSDFSSGLFAN